MGQNDQEMNLIGLEPKADSKPDTFNLSCLINSPSILPGSFSMDFKESVFYFWYNHSKPGHAALYDMLLVEFPDERIPEPTTLNTWTREFKLRATALDREVHEQIEAMVIQEKVEMLKRHAAVAVSMQNLAIDYLNEHADDLTAAGAVRLLVEGVRIERESKGIPEALDKMAKMSDEKLLEEIKKLATSSSVTLESWNADRE